MGFQISIDAEACMGTGNCVFQAPGVFEQDEDGISFVVDAEAAPDQRITLAAASCPAGAITVVRDGSPG